jgi:hypothetical protein
MGKEKEKQLLEDPSGFVTFGHKNFRNSAQKRDFSRVFVAFVRNSG